MDIDRRAHNAAVELLMEQGLAYGTESREEQTGIASFVNLAIMMLREPIQKMAREFTFESGSPAELMKDKAVHAAASILLEENDPLLSLAMMQPKGKA